jgi:hypothetical protein
MRLLASLLAAVVLLLLTRGPLWWVAWLTYKAVGVAAVNGLAVVRKACSIRRRRRRQLVKGGQQGDGVRCFSRR